MTALVRRRGTRLWAFPARGTPLWLALYALGLLCVFSFVFFEMLDVDGSSFEPTPSKVAIKVAETPHEALKRGALAPGGPPLASALVTRATEPPRPPATVERQRRGRVPTRSAASSRAALPRALLSDVPPSA
jgi:hypothetical protein